MVNLKRQYKRLQKEIDAALATVLESALFINGPEVEDFSSELADFLGASRVVPCANGTDALQIAFMTLGLKPGDEVIIPSFTYIATAEAATLLGLVPRFVDVSLETYCITAETVEKAITPRTRVIVPVHLFGQSAPMEELLTLARLYKLDVIEDNAQALGATCLLKTGEEKYTGTMGSIGCTSFFPSKNLGCYGDGGALIFGKAVGENALLASKAKQIANHGQQQKYHHEMVGCNSRLDTLQAAILRVKLQHLQNFNHRRREVACHYESRLRDLDGLLLPQKSNFGTAVYHQYSVRILGGRREALRCHLQKRGIASAVYYPIPLHQQKTFSYSCQNISLPSSERLAEEILSFPICPEITDAEIDRVCDEVLNFFSHE